MTSPKLFKLNVGGTRYEVSDSLLDQFPESMLRRLTSEAWNKNNQDGEGAAESEIFIERNGQRFQYVLDFMRDAAVALPLAIPRAQFIVDLEYYNIGYEDSQITLSVADPKDLFYDLARYRDFFDTTKKDIDQRFRQVAVEKVACELASEYFERIGRPGVLRRSGNSYGHNDEADKCVNSYFAPTELRLPAIQAPTDITVQDIKPLMEKEYGLAASPHVERMEKNYGYGNAVPVYSKSGVDVQLMSKPKEQE